MFKDFTIKKENLTKFFVNFVRKGKKLKIKFIKKRKNNSSAWKLFRKKTRNESSTKKNWFVIEVEQVSNLSENLCVILLRN